MGDYGLQNSNRREMNSPLLLTIIIPCYNQSSFIERTLNSLNSIPAAHQQQVEVIIIDDGSTDDSLELINRHIQQCEASFEWVVLSQSNQGVGAARNRGLQECRGDWLLMIDGDDELISDPIPLLTDSKATCLSFVIERVRDRNTTNLQSPLVYGRRHFYDLVTAASPFFNCSVVIRTDCVATEFDADLAYLEDWKFWIQNPGIFERMKLINQKLARYHIHENNRSSHFARTGPCRREIAQYMLSDPALKLTRKQRNNAIIQDAIGAILENKPFPKRALLAVPCSLDLAAKFALYIAMRGWTSLIHPFG